MIRTKADIKLIDACERFIREWPHFCKCLAFNKTALDDEAMRFFNEVPGEIKHALGAKLGEQTDDQI